MGSAIGPELTTAPAMGSAIDPELTIALAMGSAIGLESTTAPAIGPESTMASAMASETVPESTIDREVVGGMPESSAAEPPSQVALVVATMSISAKSTSTRISNET